jgi:hypothetical protein
LINKLGVAYRPSAERSAHFTVARNAMAEFALKGAEIAQCDRRPEIVSARAAEPPGYFTLGFDIATALFASESLGGMGNTTQGLGSNAIRNGLLPSAIAAAGAGTRPEAIRGFDASVRLYLDLEDVYAAKGEALANADPLAGLLRNKEPEGPSRRGFDVGMGIAEGQTSPGPGKDRFGDNLSIAEQNGYRIAVQYSVDRNRNLDFARSGAAIVAGDPVIESARKQLPLGLAWLGFDIATGLFGDPALGGRGDTEMGPGKQRIRDSLTNDGQMGFDASMKLHLGPPPHPRRGVG